MFLLKIDQHFRGNDSWISRIDDSQVPEEEIHGGLKSGVHTDEGDDAWVPCHSQSIDDQEDKEEWDLEVWTFWDSFEVNSVTWVKFKLAMYEFGKSSIWKKKRLG